MMNPKKPESKDSSSDSGFLYEPAFTIIKRRSKI